MKASILKFSNSKGTVTLEYVDGLYWVTREKGDGGVVGLASKNVEISLHRYIAAKGKLLEKKEND